MKVALTLPVSNASFDRVDIADGMVTASSLTVERTFSTRCTACSIGGLVRFVEALRR